MPTNCQFISEVNTMGMLRKNGSVVKYTMKKKFISSVSYFLKWPMLSTAMWIDATSLATCRYPQSFLHAGVCHNRGDTHFPTCHRLNAGWLSLLGRGLRGNTTLSNLLWPTLSTELTLHRADCLWAKLWLVAISAMATACYWVISRLGKHFPLSGEEYT